MLLADDNKQPPVSLGRPEKGLVVSECRTDEQDIIKPVTERATELVYEELPLPELIGTTMRALKGMLWGSISILHRI